jgi:hypothetical protein
LFKEALWFVFVFLVIVSSCADDESPLKEPVVSTDDTTYYNDDPSMVDSNAEHNSSPDENIKRGMDSLASDPFGPGAPPIDNSDDELMADSTPDESDDLISGGGLNQVLSDNHSTEVELTRAFPTKKKKKKLVRKKISSKNTYYIKPMLLNVRGKPYLKAKIVRRLLGGTVVSIYRRAPRGFVEIQPGEFIRAKHLSKTPIKKVTKKDVARAWQKSNIKDNWNQ